MAPTADRESKIPWGYYPLVALAVFALGWFVHQRPPAAEPEIPPAYAAAGRYVIAERSAAGLVLLDTSDGSLELWNGKQWQHTSGPAEARLLELVTSHKK